MMRANNEEDPTYARWMIALCVEWRTPTMIEAAAIRSPAIRDCVVVVLEAYEAG